MKIRCMICLNYAHNKMPKLPDFYSLCIMRFTFQKKNHYQKYEQNSPMSSLCPQSSSPHPLWLHSKREDSVPLHLTSSNHIGPEPLPKGAFFCANPVSNPSVLHAISAVTLSKWSSQTVPHRPSWRTSKRPSDGWGPPFCFTRRIELLV